MSESDNESGNEGQQYANLDTWAQHHRDTITVLQSQLAILPFGGKAWVDTTCQIRYHEGVLHGLGLLRGILRDRRERE